MRLRLPIAAAIYVGSYLPLSLILLSQDITYKWEEPLCRDWLNFSDKCYLPLKNPALATGMVIACFFCFLVTLAALQLAKPKHQIQINESKHIPADLMNYVVPYVVSFISLDYQETSKFVGFLIFLGWLFWITYESGQIILNPILTVFGWKLYEIKYTFIGSKNILTGRTLASAEISPNTAYRHAQVQDVLIIK